tara:strand:- start:914 stop:1294 length:381 start_codon:yes stop_codon:yes gene_type:complete
MKSTILYFLTFLTAFFAGIKASMIAVGFLIFIDTVLGMMAAYKVKEKISSRKFSRVLIKMLAFQLLIISAHIVNLYLFKALPLVEITLGFLSVHEFLSIAESFTKLTGMPFVSYIKEIIQSKFNNK